MRIFLSCSSKDRALAEPIYFTLRADRHKVFFDRSDLPPGQEFHAHIRQAIEAADLFIFLVSPDSISEGSYTLAGLEIARKTWDTPGGRVLPVLVRFLRPTLTPPAGKEVRSLPAAPQPPAGVPTTPTTKDASAPPAREINGKDGAAALLVPAGKFVMGDDEDSPRHDVSLDSFYMDNHEVTTSRYAKFLEATGQTRRPEYWQELNLATRGDRPVIGVSWYEADVYCRWAGKRLPTEAEWEKAGGDRRAHLPLGQSGAVGQSGQFRQTPDECLQGRSRPGG